MTLDGLSEERDAAWRREYRARARASGSALTTRLAAVDQWRAGFVPDGGKEDFDVAGVAVPEVRYAMRLSATAAAEARRG
ncbi:hypothetical protein ACGFRG_15345 [Streptomyces sp. NPDC048696]|uniref:hypothetical protein n=1 Tax=Streptomyces sp. NPDC048696 TaxID=3365585 RepID=UPI0037137870